jgi:hypothetical protein
MLLHNVARLIVSRGIQRAANLTKSSACLSVEGYRQYECVVIRVQWLLQDVAPSNLPFAGPQSSAQGCNSDFLRRAWISLDELREPIYSSSTGQCYVIPWGDPFSNLGPGMNCQPRVKLIASALPFAIREIRLYDRAFSQFERVSEAYR